jgi:hypothetical protein
MTSEYTRSTLLDCLSQVLPQIGSAKVENDDATARV